MNDLGLASGASEHPGSSHSRGGMFPDLSDPYLGIAGLGFRRGCKSAFTKPPFSSDSGMLSFQALDGEPVGSLPPGDGVISSEAHSE